MAQNGRFRAKVSAFPGYSGGGGTSAAQRDNAPNVSDSIALLGFLCQGNPTEIECTDTADVDDDGAVRITSS